MSITRQAVKRKLWPALKWLRRQPGLSFAFRLYLAASREWRSFWRVIAARRYLKQRLLDAEGKTEQGMATSPLQQVLDWHLPISDVDSVSDLKRFLTENEITFAEGYHAIYLPPQEGLARVLGAIAYPDDAGFKILKNFEPVSEAHYMVTSTGRRITAWLMQGVEKQFEAANALYLLGLGPRVYDLVELDTGKARATCFVVQHVDGSRPSVEEYEQFMEKLHIYVSDDLHSKVLSLVNPHGFQAADFRPPDCRGNLIKRQGDGALLYIDFQSFIVPDRQKLLAQQLEDATQVLHFGNTRPNRGSKPYLYQSLPGISADGKRDTQTRWTLFSQLLKDAGLDLHRRVVLDICCNAGMILAQALVAGAWWGLGWDLPDVARQAERLQTILGNTRLSFTGTHLGETYPLTKDIPHWLSGALDGSIVFYLAAWRHVGFISDLKNIPWKALVFEGHQTDSDGELNRIIRLIEGEWSCESLVSTYGVDGDSRPRPVVLFVRA